MNDYVDNLSPTRPSQKIYYADSATLSMWNNKNIQNKNDYVNNLSPTKLSQKIYYADSATLSILNNKNIQKRK